MYLDSSLYLVKQVEWDEYWSEEGLLEAVGPETVVDTLDLDPVNITAITDAKLEISGTDETHTHALSVQYRTNVKVLSTDAESAWTAAPLSA